MHHQFLMLLPALTLMGLQLLSHLQPAASLRLDYPALSSELLLLGGCADQLKKIYTRQVTITSQPKLRGYWISSGCEIRPGPEYVVRNYHFINDTYFRALQFYYLDSSCTSPFYGLEASGSVQLDENSVNSGPFGWRQNYYELFRAPMLYQVTVMPYTLEAAAYLRAKVSGNSPECRTEFGGRLWSQEAEPHDILVFVEYKNRIMRDTDCTRQLGFNLHEFLLIRVEQTLVGSRVHRQLFLGDIATNLSERYRHRPSGFQPPLEDINNEACLECYSVFHASLKKPPAMRLQARVTAFPAGEWASVVCESRPQDTYVTRHLAFDSESQGWTGTYNNFHDPLCRKPFFSFTATGRVRTLELDDRNKDARQFDFLVTGLSITPRDKRSLDQMNTYSGYGCGRTSWQINRTQDVTNTNGCDHLRLQVPTKSEQVMSVELRGGQSWLYVGGIPNTQSLDPSQRPTSFQPPLVKCRGDTPGPPQQRQPVQPRYNWNKQLAISDSSSGAAEDGINGALGKQGGSVAVTSLLLPAVWCSLAAYWTC